MKKCGTAAPGCANEEQSRAPAPHCPGVFHGKACGDIFYPSKSIGSKNLAGHHWDLGGFVMIFFASARCSLGFKDFFSAKLVIVGLRGLPTTEQRPYLRSAGLKKREEEP
jgi:hypothetical protein